ncbi:polysaccharide deacetylase family protein [Clostridium felsineum]|uniref:polysaccharide deacetylase family protein n=1 Tax=Clostridium felsineum TaxID=36839 RepID=UPI00098BD494|nr:polysaccharide deacetylase family protein [Clostridium felsineum]URZ15094.1 hypothetical protein CLFE_011110 [Clostridium felsineum DSM 794]
MNLRRRKNKKNKFLKRGLILVILVIGAAALYKGYKQYNTKKVQANETVAAHKVKVKNNKKITNKEEKKKNVIENKWNNVNEEGQKYTYDAAKVKDIIDKKVSNDGKKVVFLTFDDGPSLTVTPKILDTLKQYNVKATFSLVGKEINVSEGSRNLVKRIYNEGNAIANHTYSHNMGILYPQNKTNVDGFINEVDETNNIIKGILGQGFNTRVVRMPGGYMSRTYYHDPNLPQLDAKLNERGIYNIDWNASDFDSEGKKKNAAELIEEVKKSAGSQEKVIVLMHDTYGKEEVAKALPQIIEYFKNQGYEFRTIS